MGAWRRFHLNERISAMAIPELGRFLVKVYEPEGEKRNPREYYCSNLKDAQSGADRVVQEYYPHDCDEQRCGNWEKATRSVSS